MTNLYYNTVKMLLERISSVMVDHQALKVTLLFASPILFCHSKLLVLPALQHVCL